MSKFLLRQTVFVMSVLGLAVMSGCAAPAWIPRANNASNLPTVEKQKTDQSSGSKVDGIANENTDATTDLAVTWHEKEPIKSLHVFVSASSSEALAQAGHLYGEIPDEAMPTLDGESSVSSVFDINYYKVGTVTYQNQKSDVVIVTAQEESPFGSHNYFFFIKNNNGLTYVSRVTPPLPLSTGTVVDWGLSATAFREDTSVNLPDLVFPVSVQGANAKQTAKQEAVIDFVDNQLPTELTAAFTDAVFGQVFTSSYTNAFYLKRGPLMGVYAFKPDFIGAPGTKATDIVWSDGKANTDEFTYQTIGGCGSANYARVISADQVNTTTDLVAVGKTGSGDTIFTLKDTNHTLLKGVFETTSVPGALKQTYKEFLKQHPLVFWIDPFGRLIALQNNKFVPMAECGKPVIYLYPPKTTTTTVWLQPQGGFTYTEPNYGVNWLVRAEPSGHLTDLHTNKEYPYLFWEGRGGIYEQPKQGWVVKKTQLKTFLPTKLKQLGLNNDEAADFVEFWLPRMQAKPYYFVTFMGNSMMDKLAPLTVEPKPDTVIRILMDFTALDKPIKVSGYAIRTPKRTGFTVIEWGGVLR